MNFNIFCLSMMVTFLSMFQLSCSDDKKRPNEPVLKEKAQADNKQAKGSNPTAKAPAPGEGRIQLQVPDDRCRPFKDAKQVPPLWIKSKNFVVTRLFKECVTFDGRRGYEKDSPWVAMGIPCTGGMGRIDVKGKNYFAPKLVSFIMSTDCPMFPNNIDFVRVSGQQALGLTPEAKLKAFIPFVVQFWEIPGHSDSDVGFTIDLRSIQGKEVTWKKFRENQPIRVKLYGRENAWVVGGHFYYVEADIVMAGQRAFKLNVINVKSLSPEELADVKNRCESLRPRRKCYKVF